MCLRELVAQSWTFGCGHDPTEFWFGWLYLQHSQRRFICCRLPLSILQHVRSKTWRPWSKRNNSFVRTPTDNQGTAESLCSGKHGWLSWQKMPNRWPFCVKVWRKWAMWFSRKKAPWHMEFLRAVAVSTLRLSEQMPRRKNLSGLMKSKFPKARWRPSWRRARRGNRRWLWKTMRTNMERPISGTMLMF